MVTDAEKKRKAELWKQYADNPSIDLRNKIIESYLGYARYLARKFWVVDPGWCEYDDLESVACMAMVKAFDHYRPERGVAFPTYAHRAIINDIVAEAVTYSDLPRNAGEKRRKIMTFVSRYKTKHINDPSISDIFTGTGIAEDIAASLVKWNKYTGDNEAVLAFSCFSRDDPVESAITNESRINARKVIVAAGRKMSKRHRLIFRLRYRKEWTLEAIGKRLGVSKERIRQIIDKSVVPKLVAEVNGQNKKVD